MNAGGGGGGDRRMNMPQALAAAGGTYKGHGLNREQERFAGELQVEPPVGGAAVPLRYRATLDDGTVVPQGRLTYAYAWGLPGGPFADRSQGQFAR